MAYYLLGLRYNVKRKIRFQLNLDTGELESAIAKASLQRILEQDRTLSQFADIPHQKNGVDIEGIAVKNDLLYFGFRTPILEENYAPVIVVQFEQIDLGDQYELRYVNLGGNGIRDLVSVDEGFLILADETADDGSDYQVYFWDGSNDRSSKSHNTPAVTHLQEIPAKKNTRTEGLTVLSETASGYEVLIVYDGVAKGNPTVFELTRIVLELRIEI